jgi:hypothetical protein
MGKYLDTALLKALSQNLLRRTEEHKKTSVMRNINLM